MGKVIGGDQYKGFKVGEFLTMKDAILANCYMCNGFEESSEDCGGRKSCALYPFSPYGRDLGLHISPTEAKNSEKRKEHGRLAAKRLHAGKDGS